MAGQMFKRACQILTDEGIKFEKEVVAKIVEKHFPDYRRTINELQRYSTAGDINAGVLSQVSDIQKLSDLIGYLREKSFGNMRKWVAQNSDVEPAKIFRRVYDGMYEYFKPESIPQAVVIIAKYQYQSAFVADQEINLVACLTELMVDCEVI